MALPVYVKQLIAYLHTTFRGIRKSRQVSPSAMFPLDERNREIYECLASDIDEIADMFYNKCVEAADTNNRHKLSIVNKNIGGKAALATRAFQLVFIAPQLEKYLPDHDAAQLVERLLRCTQEQRDALHCHDLYQCYMKLGGSVRKKYIYYFSVDIAKYILGYESGGFPSSFPCLSSYISSGIPRDILTRSDVTQVALLVQTLIPKIKVATDLAIAYCFKDKSHIFDIKSEI